MGPRTFPPPQNISGAHMRGMGTNRAAWKFRRRATITHIAVYNNILYYDVYARSKLGRRRRFIVWYFFTTRLLVALQSSPLTTRRHGNLRAAAKFPARTWPAAGMMNLYSECNLRRICLGAIWRFESRRAPTPYTTPTRPPTHPHTHTRLALSARSAFVFYRSRVAVRRVERWGRVAQGRGWGVSKRTEYWWAGYKSETFFFPLLRRRPSLSLPPLLQNRARSLV